MSTHVSEDLTSELAGVVEDMTADIPGASWFVAEDDALNERQPDQE